MKRDAGFALLNALVIVAAMSAAAVFLMQLSEAARFRLELAQDRAQITAYLDAGEDLVSLALDADRRQTSADHPREGWARTPFAYDIDRGRITGSLRDLQGLFNVNSLANPDDGFSQTTFNRLLQGLGLPESLGGAIRLWIAGAGAPQSAAIAAGAAMRPPGHPILALDELRAVPGITEARLGRLRAVLAATRQEGAININSAPVAVLRAALPALRPAQIDALAARRRATPFESTEDILAYLLTTVGEDRLGEIEAERFGVSSDWVEAELTAHLGGAQLSRRVILHRAPETGLAEVALRFAPDPLAAAP